jgi:hypothetical protein
MKMNRKLQRLIIVLALSIPGAMYAQQTTTPEILVKPIIQLSGIVKNDSLQTLPFVSIVVPNRNQGTVSDFWGYFSIAVYPNDTVRFSSVGYKTYFFIFPEDFIDKEHDLNVYLEEDTVFLSETVIFPWTSYDQFLKAVVALELQDEEMERARKNIALMQKQIFSQEYQVDASLNYKYYMSEKANQAYTAGQLPTISLLNPFAWAQFFEALKSGLFSNKKKN